MKNERGGGTLTIKMTSNDDTKQSLQQFTDSLNNKGGGNDQAVALDVL